MKGIEFMTNKKAILIKHKYSIDENTTYDELKYIINNDTSHRFEAISLYLLKAVKDNDYVDLHWLEEAYHHPVDILEDPMFIPSFFLRALYYFKNNYCPLLAVSYLKISVLSKETYDCSKALMAMFYTKGFGVEKDLKIAEWHLKDAKKEMSNWKEMCSIYPSLSVYKLKIKIPKDYESPIEDVFPLD